MPLQGGIRETDDVVRWHSQDRRRLESGIRETDNIMSCHSQDRRRLESVTRETINVLRQISITFLLSC